MKPTAPSQTHALDHAVHVRTHAWWKHEQTAWCPFCSQGYAWELHVVCVGCDRPACPLCIDREDPDGPRCPECASGEEAPA